MTAFAQHRGSLTVGACIPIAVTAAAEAKLVIEGQLLELNARIAGLLELQASLTLTPPTLAASLQAAIDLATSLAASLSLGLPGVDFQLAGVAELLATLNVSLGALQVSLAAILEMEATLGTAGVHMYVLGGGVADAGQEFATAVSGGLPSGGGPTQEVVGVVLLAGASAPEAQIALSATFGLQIG